MKDMEELKKAAEEYKANLLAGLAPEERLKGLTPEQRLQGLTPEQRLAGLTPEQLAELVARLSQNKEDSPSKKRSS